MLRLVITIVVFSVAVGKGGYSLRYTFNSGCLRNEIFEAEVKYVDVRLQPSPLDLSLTAPKFRFVRSLVLFYWNKW